ncbi:hypothetical protein BT63DRAFT_12568 [Microthyrium microscopicum]|uniref:DUF8035 domain-containing protein n=1 Tax=Microthyrium microscopicum TaxID=703497 RepID=A0A6A6USQ9_9PEZI|nr:hypothetical protein BT63DRAFT_12568 [Microthyrium microscopicum]
MYYDSQTGEEVPDTRSTGNITSERARSTSGSRSPRFSSPSREQSNEWARERPIATATWEALAVRHDEQSSGDLEKGNLPPDARWTKIDRTLVNPEALLEANERFEERLDCVIVLRVLTKQEIQDLADRTERIRANRNTDSQAAPGKYHGNARNADIASGRELPESSRWRSRTNRRSSSEESYDRTRERHLAAGALAGASAAAILRNVNFTPEQEKARLMSRSRSRSRSPRLSSRGVDASNDQNRAKRLAAAAIAGASAAAFAAGRQKQADLPLQSNIGPPSSKMLRMLPGSQTTPSNPHVGGEELLGKADDPYPRDQRRRTVEIGDTTWGGGPPTAVALDRYNDRIRAEEMKQQEAAVSSSTELEAGQEQPTQNSRRRSQDSNDEAYSFTNPLEMYRDTEPRGPRHKSSRLTVDDDSVDPLDLTLLPRSPDISPPRRMLEHRVTRAKAPKRQAYYEYDRIQQEPVPVSDTVHRYRCLEDWDCKKGAKGFSRYNDLKRHVMRVHSKTSQEFEQLFPRTGQVNVLQLSQTHRYSISGDKADSIEPSSPNPNVTRPTGHGEPNEDDAPRMYPGMGREAAQAASTGRPRLQSYPDNALRLEGGGGSSIPIERERTPYDPIERERKPYVPIERERKPYTVVQGSAKLYEDAVLQPLSNTPGRPPRRREAHTAMPCVNCTRAKLSCDEARPCKHCVSTHQEASLVVFEVKGNTNFMNRQHALT